MLGEFVLPKEMDGGVGINMNSIVSYSKDRSEYMTLEILSDNNSRWNISMLSADWIAAHKGHLN